jgi:RimJ/RimL family protein N-acetyltransferase
MILQTERITLRPLTKSDLDELSRLLADPLVMQYSLQGPLSQEQAKEYLQGTLSHHERCGFGLYALVHNDGMIGFAGFVEQMIEGEKRIELWYRLDPKYWGKGLMSEAVRTLTHYAFHELQLPEFYSIIDQNNARSIQVARRLGMSLWKKSVFHEIPVCIYVLKKVVVEPYQEEWEEAFSRERDLLKKSLPIDFFHIGSTSVPGCAAKPIIDIMGVAQDVTLLDTLELEGYEALGENGMKQRRFFRKKDASAVHLHIFEESDPEVERHLRFTNYLRSHPKAVQEYSLLKEQLAKKYPEDILKYIQGKEKLIREMDIKAAAEAEDFLYRRKKGEKKWKWTSSEILKAMETNCHLHMIYFAKCTGIAELLFQHGVSVVRSKVPDSTFNYALSTEFTKEMSREKVEEVIALLGNTSFSWWCFDFQISDELEKAFSAAGLILKEENAGMVLDLDRFVPKNSFQLRFKQSSTLEGLKDFATVLACTGESEEIFERLYSHIPPILYREGNSLEMHVGYLEGKPVVTGILVLHAGVGGLYYIATVPEERRKGFGTEITEYLLQRAKNAGYHRATLQASSQGESLYRRLGFKACCLFKEYGNKI